MLVSCVRALLLLAATVCVYAQPEVVSIFHLYLLICDFVVNYHYFFNLFPS